ncbi:MAG: ATP-binding cassette domain-containing protein, partial [Bacteroidales bacterium]|nr:ATP-binding cassette domain-containing protein [Bacteroidales bacterium]
FEAPVDYSYQIIRSIINIFSELIVFFIIIIVVIFVNFKIAILLILIYIPLMYLFYFIKRKKVAEIAQTNKITHNEILKILYNSVKGFTDIRLFNKQSYFIKKYLKNNHSYQKIRSKTFVILEIPRRAVEIIIVLMLILLVVFGKYYIDNNNSLNILISTVIAISYKLLPSLNKTYMNIIKVKTAWYSVEIVKELNNNSIENATGTENENLKFKKSIKLKNFNFSYNDTNQQVFKNLNFDVEKGDFIGIIGKSGSGKTSLLNILSGLIIQDNILKIDDKFLSIKNVKNWYKQIGYVTQNSYIFNGSICENIALGIKKSEINHNKLNDVLALVELDFWAKSLPNGKNTILGENGSKISEGQKQRLALARVLYKKTDLLLLDEITGNLDFETEDSIIKLLEKLNKEGKTIIFVSHRKNTLKNCNKIFKIENYKLNNYEYQL